MSLKRSSNGAESPNTAIVPQPAKKTKKGTDIVLPGDVWSEIVTFADWRGFRALACACRTTRDAACDVDWLARDKATVLRCFLAIGGKEDTLRRGYWGDIYTLKMRDEPSDNLAEWFGVTVEGGRVTELDWYGTIPDWHNPLTGTIPAEIGALDGLTHLRLYGNQICGHLPSEIGRLTSLEHLSIEDNRLEGPLPAELGALTALTFVQLDHNNFTGEIPTSLANLTNLGYLDLDNNNFDTDIPSDLFELQGEGLQTFLALLQKQSVRIYVRGLSQRIEELEAENEKFKARSDELKAKYDELKAKYEPDL